MDGVPFMACGQQTLVCQFGAERSHDKKETTVKEEPSKPPTEHQYSEAMHHNVTSFVHLSIHLLCVEFSDMKI